MQMHEGRHPSVCWVDGSPYWNVGYRLASHVQIMRLERGRGRWNKGLRRRSKGLAFCKLLEAWGFKGLGQGSYVTTMCGGSERGTNKEHAQSPSSKIRVAIYSSSYRAGIECKVQKCCQPNFQVVAVCSGDTGRDSQAVNVGGPLKSFNPSSHAMCGKPEAQGEKQPVQGLMAQPGLETRPVGS